MFERVSRSFELVKASASVLGADRELLLFPVISAVLSIVVLVSFAVPMFLAGVFDATALRDSGFPLAGYLIGFLFYVVQYTVIFFCNTALVGAALIRLRGGDPTLADGFRIATSRLGVIVGYAVVAATVGMVLRAISERVGLVGKLVVGLLGFAWNVATYLVVPVLAVEDVGPIEAIQRSAAYLKKTWGEQIIGNLGMGTAFGLITLGTLAGGVALFIGAATTESVPLMIAVGVLLVVLLLAIALVSSALSGVYTAAVYRYAVEGETGTFFSAAMVQDAFRLK
jgi:hypothetical protein